MLAPYLDIAEKTGVIPCFVGQPGIGKTAQVKAWAKEHGRTVETLCLSMIEPGEFLGIPMPKVINGIDTVVYAAPNWFVKLTDKSILFLDEISNARPDIRSDFLTLLSDRRLNERVLPEGCMIVCACNPISSSENGYEFSESFITRMSLIHATNDIKATAAFLQSIGNPLSDYILENPTYMPSDNDSAQMVKSLPKANNRTIELAGKILALGKPTRAAKEMINGLVGPVIGNQIIKFLNFQSTSKVDLLKAETDEQIIVALENLTIEIEDDYKQDADCAKHLKKIIKWLEKSKRFDLLQGYLKKITDLTFENHYDLIQEIIKIRDEFEK